jgi:hypothetical protein
MLGMPPVRWLHFSFDRHEVVRANGCLSESLYMGPMVLRNLPRNIQYRLRVTHTNSPTDDALNGPMARQCPTLGQAERSLPKYRRSTNLEQLKMSA